jgi:hypothetical protein
MYCVLCGTSSSLETRPTAHVQLQVRARYKDGPFAWLALQHADPVRDVFCAHCLNHIRKRRHQKMRGMLPMDQFLVSILCPGPMLDRRCYQRMWSCIGQKSNPFRFTGVQVLDELTGKRGGVLAWWERNLETKFFRSKDAASLVRRALEKRNT